MGNYEQLKAAITNVIKTNGTQSITGQILQNSLLAMINSLGSNYQLVGIATTATNPGTPDQNVFYLAGEGTYTNFSNLTIEAGQLGILKWNGSWSKEVLEIGSDGGNKILDWNTDVATTRKQVLLKNRKPGLMISYKDPTKGWVNEQYVGTQVADAYWILDSNWMQNAGGNKILDWNTDVATTRKQVSLSDRKPGLQISYNEPGKGWKTEQFVGIDVNDISWVISSFWEKVVVKKNLNYIISNKSYVNNFSDGAENIQLEFIKGFIDVKGNFNTSTGFICTDFVEIEPNTPYSILGINETGIGAYSAFYDSGNTKLTSWQSMNGSHVTISPANAKYMRISAKVTSNVRLYKGICNISADTKEAVCINGGRYSKLFDLVKTNLYNKDLYIRKGYAPFGTGNNIGSVFSLDGYNGASSTLLIPVVAGNIYYLDGLTTVNNIVTIIVDSGLKVQQKFQANSGNGNGKASIVASVDGYMIAAIDDLKIDSFYVSLVENDGNAEISIPKLAVQNAVIIPQSYETKTIKWKNKRAVSQGQNLSVLVMDCYGLPFDSGDNLEFYVKYISENVQTSTIQIGYSIQIAGQQSKGGTFNNVINSVENGAQKEANFSLSLSSSQNVLYDETDANLGFVFWTNNEDVNNEYTIEVVEAYIYNVTKGYYITRPITLGIWGGYQEEKYPRVVSPSENFAIPLYNKPFITNSALPTDNRNCKGLRILCLGDSITAGTAWGYVRWLQYCTGAGIQNVGSSGAGINRLVKILCGWNDWDGGNATPAIDLSNFDIVTIMIGTNGGDLDTTMDDAYTEHTMWDLPFNDGSEDITTKEQFANKYLKTGFLNNYQVLIQYILTENPNIKIFLITPPICERETWTLAERRMIQLQSLADYYNIPMINAYKAMGWNKWDFKDNFSNDANGVHLNEKGNKQWGGYIGNDMNQYFVKNKI